MIRKENVNIIKLKNIFYKKIIILIPEYNWRTHVDKLLLYRGKFDNWENFKINDITISEYLNCEVTNKVCMCRLMTRYSERKMVKNEFLRNVGEIKDFNITVYEVC